MIDNQKLVDITYLLKNIICFLYDVEYSADIDYKEDLFENIEPKNYKQRIFKDLNFIEILIEIIHLPFCNKFYKISEVHSFLYIPDVLTLSYSCIRNAIQEYRPSELYTSQWIDLMIEYSLSRLDSKIQANETLTELIDNNQRILETRIKKSTIIQFVENLAYKGGDSRYVDILRAIIICDNKPMLKNQNIVTDIMISDERIRTKLIKPLKLKENTIYLMKPYDA